VVISLDRYSDSPAPTSPTEERALEDAARRLTESPRATYNTGVSADAVSARSAGSIVVAASTVLGAFHIFAAAGRANIFAAARCALA